MTKQLQYKEKQLDAYMRSTFYYHFVHAPSTENTHAGSDERGNGTSGHVVMEIFTHQT